MNTLSKITVAERVQKKNFTPYLHFKLHPEHITESDIPALTLPNVFIQPISIHQIFTLLTNVSHLQSNMSKAISSSFTETFHI